MSTTIGAMIGVVLMVAGPVAVVVLAVVLVGAVGLMAYDVFSSRQRTSVEPKAARVLDPEATKTRIYLERSVARAFVILGGAFWGVATFAGLFWFGTTGMFTALAAASLPLLAVLATLVLGWYWERVASIALALASVAAVYWGVASGFEPGVWMIVTVALIGPMSTASVLFWLARRDQEALELSLAMHPELQPIAVDGSLR